MTQLFNAKPFIIAEVGSNWTTFAEAKDSIRFAKQAGAHAVKFQAFDGLSLHGPACVRKSDGTPSRMEGALPLEWLPKLKEKADACGIEFMCSAFSDDLYDAVNPYVDVHKIASSELTNIELLYKVKSFGKPIILSCGASSKRDVHLALQALSGSKLVLMYCSSAYPSCEYNLFYMKDLAESFSVPMGLSDHSLDVCYPALSAVHHFGAIAIEKHVNFTEHQTPDSAHSLNHAQFVIMCELLNGKRSYTEFNPMPEEKDMFLKHNRRLIATKDIGKGQMLKYGENFGAYRSLKEDTKGLTPFAWGDIEGYPVKCDIKTGDSIGPQEVDKQW